MRVREALLLQAGDGGFVPVTWMRACCVWYLGITSSTVIVSRQTCELACVIHIPTYIHARTYIYLYTCAHADKHSTHSASSSSIPALSAWRYNDPVDALLFPTTSDAPPPPTQ